MHSFIRTVPVWYNINELDMEKHYCFYSKDSGDTIFELSNIGFPWLDISLADQSFYLFSGHGILQCYNYDQGEIDNTC